MRQTCGKMEETTHIYLLVLPVEDKVLCSCTELHRKRVERRGVIAF